MKKRSPFFGFGRWKSYFWGTKYGNFWPKSSQWSGAQKWDFECPNPKTETTFVHGNSPPNWWNRYFPTFGWVISQFWKIAFLGPFILVGILHPPNDSQNVQIFQEYIFTFRLSLVSLRAYIGSKYCPPPIQESKAETRALSKCTHVPRRSDPFGNFPNWEELFCPNWEDLFCPNWEELFQTWKPFQSRRTRALPFFFFFLPALCKTWQKINYNSTNWRLTQAA